MASFRGQKTFPMMSGDVPRYTKEVSRKKSAKCFLRFKLWSENSETSPNVGGQCHILLQGERKVVVSQKSNR